MEKAIDELTDLVAAPVVASLAFQADKIGGDDFLRKIEAFARRIGNTETEPVSGGR